MIHKDLICAHSKFFAAACSESWLEGQTKVVTLRERAPVDFQAYVVWLHTHTVAVQPDPAAMTSELRKKWAQNVLLIRLYLLGEFIGDLQLRNHVMKSLLELKATFPAPDFIRHIWDHTIPKNPLRRMLVDKAIMCTERASITDRIERYPEGFVQDLAVGLLRQTGVTMDKASFAERYDEYLELETSTDEAERKV